MTLLPCPFTHHKNMIDATGDDGPPVRVLQQNPALFVVNCAICDAFGPPGETAGDAARKWNARPKIKRVPEKRKKRGRYKTRDRLDDLARQYHKLKAQIDAQEGAPE